MDQQTLRQWEKRCIQEEQPFCQAACPLHVDGRAFLGLLAKGGVDGARKVLERTLPLPGVLGRICEAPCEAACKRREAGGALAIGALERFAVTHGKAGPKPLRLPGKKGAAQLLGRGLSALACAWDLLKKGWSVTLRTGGRPLGDALLELPPEILPPDVLAAEIGTLKALGLTLDETPGDGRAALAAALAADSPLFLEWGFSPETDADFPARADVSPVTLAPPAAEGQTPRIFYGGWPDADGTRRFIDAAADGRRAASSLDRRLSGASLTAAREKEGAQSTRLFTSLRGVEPAPRVAPAAGDYDRAEATREAARCLDCQCLECVRVCPYLERHKAHPKVYARQIYNNAAIVKGQHLANRLTNSCSLCGLCARVCPEGFDMGELCLAARRDMVDRAVMPPSAHEFALEDMAWANDAITPGGFALTRPDPARDAREACAQVFFPGCQLCASSPHHVESVYEHLRRHMPGGVGLMLRCCGVPAEWAGRRDLFHQAAGQFAEQWESLGRPLVVAACAGCLSALRRPEYREAAPGLTAISLWEALEQLPPTPGGVRPSAPLALHDPCAARDDAPFRAAARALAVRAGATVEELPLSGAHTECCGFGGLMGMVDAQLAHDVAVRRAGASPRDYLSCCAMCRDRLFKAGKPGLHLLDLLFPGPAPDPARRPAPGWSIRQENRAALRAKLARELWGEIPAKASPKDDDPELVLASGVEAMLEDRRILLADLRRAVGEALSSGRLLADADPAGGGRLLASFRPRRVTFWVEFVPKDGRCRVLRAWSHRMIVPGAGGVAESLTPGSEAVNREDQVYLPENGQWRCHGCDAPLAPAPVVMNYLNSVFTIRLLTCPACGQALVPEGLALGRMAEVEQLLEDK